MGIMNGNGEVLIITKVNQVTYRAMSIHTINLDVKKEVAPGFSRVGH